MPPDQRVHYLERLRVNLADELLCAFNLLLPIGGYKTLIGGSDPGGVSYTLLDAFNSTHLVDRIGMCSHMTHIARASEQSEHDNIDYP